jgi:hypothetical protein
MHGGRDVSAPGHAWSRPGWASERPLNDPAVLEAFCYTDRLSYKAGDQVAVHVHTTAPEYSLTVLRDGAEPQTVLEVKGLTGTPHETPQDAYAVGCGWPVSTTLDVDESWRSGFYLLVIRAERDGEEIEHEHYFVVRASEPGSSSSIALVLSTSTLHAYNDWGGANHYRGLEDASCEPDRGSPFSSTQRPVARGLLRKPVGAPRSRTSQPLAPHAVPRHEAYEWARLNGYSRHHADAFWATYERPFVVWAEEYGYPLEYLTQHDLHEDPEALAPYECAVFVGHDEYWSWEMRDAVDAHLDRGGNVARFGGNFLWQVRLEQEGTVQVCYKDPGLDPVTSTDRAHLTSTAWDHPVTGRPAAQSMGLTGLGGVYSRYGAACPRSSGGFTVYRPYHWALADTDLYYGDLLGGAPALVATFELDGVDYTFRDGLPYATQKDGAPESLEIIAMAPAVKHEEDRWSGSVRLGDPGPPEAEALRIGVSELEPDGRRRPGYGAGMVATFTRGAGTGFNAGSAEWVAGLITKDWYVERITANVLDRLGGLS